MTPHFVDTKAAETATAYVDQRVGDWTHATTPLPFFKVTSFNVGFL
jgi:hypothetical protein